MPPLMHNILLDAEESLTGELLFVRFKNQVEVLACYQGNEMTT